MNCVWKEISGVTWFMDDREFISMHMVGVLHVWRKHGSWM